MIEHVVSLPLAKQLKEAGVPQESEFVYSHQSSGWEIFPYTVRKGLYGLKDNDWCSAFLASELGEMLPDGYHVFRGFDDSFKDKESKWWCVFFSDPELDNSLEEWIEGDTMANAIAKMLLYLVKEGIISLGERMSKPTPPKVNDTPDDTSDGTPVIHSPSTRRVQIEKNTSDGGMLKMNKLLKKAIKLQAKYIVEKYLEVIKLLR